MKERLIYLIRHAQPAGDGVPRFLGRADPPLSLEGRLMARRLGAYLGPVVEGAVYSSPLRRCLETARALDANCVPVPGLEEIDLGEWDGKARAEIQARYPEAYAHRGRDFAHFSPPRGESFSQVAQRAWRAMEEILVQSEGDMAVVAHAGVNRTLLCAVAGKPLQELMAFPQHYCGVSVLRASPTGLALEAVDQLLWLHPRGILK